MVHDFSLQISNDLRRSHEPACMTCKLVDECQYFDAHFSPTGQYYIEGCLGPSVPFYILKSTLGGTNGETLNFISFICHSGRQKEKKMQTRKININIA